ncbi:DUF1501 domain-containing protein [Runella aurantiaca]|uniref:DUF1501 domain-containing protein n=1 Tax=Runella aurantiaca TaxID=2282308 RepID=A0A369HZW0_9BACT|nr:DUF1501 domain-containing protein [Runella aurantiaca]RDB03061.1 DUF1501 domain-containing protein [Runella aurantiaca]
MKRRTFLKKTAFTTAGSLLIPQFLKAYEQKHFGQKLLNDKILVVIQLSGGNDGLNTVVPFRNDIYYRERPSIAINQNNVLRLNDEIGFNPALEKIKELYDNGLVSVINNVGYPNPDRSHFRSMDIWQTGSSSEEYLSSGWIGRYLDAQCIGQSCLPHQALEIDDTLSLALKGQQVNGLSLQNPEKLYRQTQSAFVKTLTDIPAADNHDNVAYLYKTLAETVSSAEYVHTKAKVNKSRMMYPTTELGKSLNTIAELITSGVSTSVYYVSLSGFDTHIRQNDQQDRLLRQYAEAVSIFVNDMKANSRLDDVMVLTFSEFGRRVKQNASSGTDHGTANNVFLIGGPKRTRPILNEAPDLTNLDNGDLKYSIDFREVYATLLDDWLHTDSTKVLTQKFNKLPLF